MLRPRRVLVSVRAGAERLHQSLFFVPALFVVAGIVLAQAVLELDEAIDPSDVPRFARTTVEGGRAVVATTAGGIITAATLVVSLSLVAVQVTASQFSPRTLRSFIGDRFQQTMIGILVGTVAYALWVLRALTGSGSGAGSTDTPDLAVLLAVLLALGSLLAVLASIDHTARGLRVGAVARSIERETIDVVRRRSGPTVDRLAAAAPLAAPAAPEPGPPVVEGSEIVAPSTGWIQQIDDGALLEAVPEGSTVALVVAVGVYVFEGQVVARVSVPDGTLDEDRRLAVAKGLAIGDERTMQQDVGFGVTRLVDIALRALSPGVNDPNTAEEVVVRLGAVVLCILSSDLGGPVVERDGRRLVRSYDVGHDDYVDLAFASIRRHAADEPHVLTTLLRTLRSLEVELARRDRTAGVERLRVHQREIAAQVDGIGTGTAGAELPPPSGPG